MSFSSFYFLNCQLTNMQATRWEKMRCIPPPMECSSPLRTKTMIWFQMATAQQRTVTAATGITSVLCRIWTGSIKLPRMPLARLFGCVAWQHMEIAGRSSRVRRWWLDLKTEMAKCNKLTWFLFKFK